VSLVWFGDVSRRSGRTATRTKRSTVRSAWRRYWLWWLSLWLAERLLQSFTLFQRVRSWKRRGRSTRRSIVKRENWSQRGLVIQVVHRTGMGPVISATYGNSSGSFYAIREVKDWLLSLGLEPDEPVMEWLWSLQERSHD